MPIGGIASLERMPARLDRLLADFAWDRMDNIFLNNSTPARSAA